MLTAGSHNFGWPMSDDLHKPNWLFRGLILFSVGVHLLLVLQMTRFYQPGNIARIELTLKQAATHSQREIPKPRTRLRPLTDSHDRVAAPAAAPQSLGMKPPAYAMPAPIDPGRTSGKNQLPRIPVFEDTEVAAWQDEPEPMPEAVPSGNAGHTENEVIYTDQVLRKIEAAKRYPKRARRRNIQGVVDIVFTIGSDGGIVSVKIVESSGSRILDRAAVDAVKRASPFPIPPNGTTIIQLPIKFELL